MSNELKITDKLLTKLRGAYLGWKQGEALERNTKPTSREEGLGLGFFNVHANLALSTIQLLETIINDISGCEGTEMYQFAQDVAIASGSRKAKRLEKSLETIGAIGQVIEMQKGQRPLPESVDLNE